MQVRSVLSLKGVSSFVRSCPLCSSRGIRRASFFLQLLVTHRFLSFTLTYLSVSPFLPRSSSSELWLPLLPRLSSPSLTGHKRDSCNSTHTSLLLPLLSLRLAKGGQNLTILVVIKSSDHILLRNSLSLRVFLLICLALEDALLDFDRKTVCMHARLWIYRLWHRVCIADDHGRC